MEGSTAILLFLAAAGVVLVVRLAAGHFDRARILEYVLARGGTVQAIHWQPFGRGWYGERGDRIYEVHFVDRHGVERHAHCKTSAFSGVYWTDGSPDVAADDPEVARLREENRRLREQLESR